LVAEIITLSLTQTNKERCSAVLKPAQMTAILTLLGVIVGALITAGSSFLLEQRRQKWASEERKYATVEKEHLMFAERRLNALQNAVQLCDFLDSLN